MGIALYYAVLIGAVAGSVYYLRSGIKQLREWKAAPEDHPHVRAIALWKTGLGALGTHGGGIPARKNVPPYPATRKSVIALLERYAKTSE